MGIRPHPSLLLLLLLLLQKKSTITDYRYSPFTGQTHLYVDSLLRRSTNVPVIHVQMYSVCTVCLEIGEHTDFCHTKMSKQRRKDVSKFIPRENTVDIFKVPSEPLYSLLVQSWYKDTRCGTNNQAPDYNRPKTLSSGGIRGDILHRVYLYTIY